MNEEIGYAPLPGAFVIDTRKSLRMFFAAALAAAVTAWIDARTNSPSLFCTDP